MGGCVSCSGHSEGGRHSPHVGRAIRSGRRSRLHRISYSPYVLRMEVARLPRRARHGDIRSSELLRVTRRGMVRLIPLDQYPESGSFIPCPTPPSSGLSHILFAGRAVLRCRRRTQPQACRRRAAIHLVGRLRAVSGCGAAGHEARGLPARARQRNSAGFGPARLTCGTWPARLPPDE